MEVIEDFLEIATSIFLYVMAAALTLTLLVFCQDPIIQLGQDKTLVESEGVQQLYKENTYGYDILLMLLNTDEMSPFPKAIKINNSPVLKLTNEFIANKMSNITKVYSASGSYKLSTMLDYVVTSEEYVYSGTDAPYIHYILEEVR